MGTTLRAAPSKSYNFSTNYHACIAMPTWPRCAPPILCWPWPPYNLLPRSCLTCNGYFFIDPHWWVPLCVQRPAKAMPFQQIIMHALQCKHDLDVRLLFCVDHYIHVHLFCFDLHKFLLRSRTTTCPTLNCGRGTSLFRQELVTLKLGCTNSQDCYENKHCKWMVSWCIVQKNCWIFVFSKNSLQK